MENKKISIDIVNNGKEFQPPALNLNIETDLYIDLLKISMDAEKEMEPYKNKDDSKMYHILINQRINQKRLIRILQTIDPAITHETVNQKGTMWINNTLVQLYENAPDKNLDFQRTAAAEKNVSPLPNNTTISSGTSTGRQLSPDTPSNA
jgi:hypothetical protein